MEFITGFGAGVLAGIMSLVWWEIILLLALFIFGSVSLAKESGIGFVIVGIITVFVLFGLEPISFFESIKLIGTYIAVGFIWSFIKWFLYVRDRKKHIDDVVHPSEYRIDDKENNANFTFSYEYRDKLFLKRVNSNIDKDIIFFWIIAWPFSVLGFIFGDLILKLISSLGGTYRYITKLAM
jgi:hypothetical protein